MALGNGLSWMIGGAQGSGVDSAANIFARACNFGGLYVFGKREYYSNIMGEHSYFHVRVSDRPVRSHLDSVHLLATFDNETIVRHAGVVTPDGGIVYDPSGLSQSFAEIPTLEKRLVADLRARMREQRLGESVQDVLEAAGRNGVHLYPIPYTDLLKEVAEDIGEAKLSKLSKMVNTMAVASSFALVGFDHNALPEAIRATFRAKPKIAEMNILAAQRAADYVEQRFRGSFRFQLARVETEEERIYVQGDQAVALGKLLGGCRFQTYYPITPATDESAYLEEHEVFETRSAELLEAPQLAEVSALKQNGGSTLVVQTEDEIAAITMAIGAALSGARSSTSTSGPGFSLMVEGLGWAGMNEVPVVVTLYQRAGPSTGLPTRHEQGDLRFVLHGGHGEFPRIVLASGDLEECFYDAVRAFNYAEKYQLPVIHLIDKALANSSQTYGVFPTEGVRIERGSFLGDDALGRMLPPGERYRRFLLTESGISPRVPLGTRGARFWNTGDEHDELGHITEDPVLRVAMMEKRMRKLDLAAREIPDDEKVSVYGPSNADVTLVSWGSTKGAILDGMDMLAEEGLRANFVQIRLLSPFPSERVLQLLARARKKVHVEMNYSAQLAGLIRQHTGIEMDGYVLKYNGRPMSCNEIYEGVREALAPRAPKRVVLTHGA